MLNDTVASIATPLKEGAISIIRISGPDSFEIVNKISDIKRMEANTIVYGHIYDKDEIVDEVLVSFFRGPKSFTGEDVVEINCHGGVYLTRKILNIVLSCGIRNAEPGEFSKRAYLNGRIDLSEAESINDLIRANNRFQARSAVRGLNGSVSKLLDPMMKEMRDVISMIDVNIDYPEYYDEKQMSLDEIKPYVKKWIAECRKMIDQAERFRVIKDGLDTVIIGKPNVGKSSLLNALLGYDKAIVTDIEGTTRDLVEGKVNLENISLNLIDTAGIRESKDIVENIGIERSKEALKKAELVLLVIDASNIDEKDEELLNMTEGYNRIVVYNKNDLNNHEGISICAKDGDIVSLTDYLNDRYKDDTKLVDEDVLNNERQISLMKKCLYELAELEAGLDYVNLDVLELNLEEAYHSLSDILGREYREDLIDHLFRNFCLGK
ncbi:MAG: tRNA uridine-5-carboxymethylaminomethyl(34) synthesis GTPase MnmE [Erysipelotrichaceae bacterium]